VPALDSLAYGYAEDSQWALVNSTFPATCTSTLGEVAVQERWPLRTGGSMSFFREHGPLLMLTNPDAWGEASWRAREEPLVKLGRFRAEALSSRSLDWRSRS